MKRINTLFSVVLSLVLISLSVVPAYASESSYDLLLKNGFSQSFLESVPNEMIEKIASQLSNDVEITNIYKKTIYLYEDNSSEIQPRGAISEASLALEIDAVEICRKDTDIIAGVLVAISWDWAGTKPFQRWQDALTVNWDAALFSFSEDSFYSVDSGKSEEEDEWIAEFEYTRATHHAQGGLGFYSRMSAVYKRTAGAAMFLLLPKISMVSGSSQVTDINVNYVHDRSFLFPLSIGFNTVGFHVGFDINRNSYDEAADSANFRYSLGG